MQLHCIPATSATFLPGLHNPLLHLLLLSLLPGGAELDSSRGTEGPVGTTQCRLDEADHCFQELFNHMPICSAAELTFRCQHFNVLDTCFRQSNIMCLPSAVGQTAKLAYRRKLNECSKDTYKKYRQTSQQQKSWSTKSTSSNRFPSPPNELQFISLFGYLQSQCRRKPNSDSGPEGEMTAVMSATQSQGRRSKEEEEPTSAEQRQAPVRSNCSTHELKELIGGCEAEMKQKSPSAKMGGKRKHVLVDLERHQLLRVKLEASSRLLIYPETRRNDECLMVRSVLSDIFQLHQKYCFQTTMTKCLCERLNFEHFCGIACDQLEPQGSGLPFEKTLLWTDFRGRLSGHAGGDDGDGSGVGGVRKSRGLSFLLLLNTLIVVTAVWSS